ncbi:MAG: DUF3794 domain-containing protein [Clostridia bacterium]|nr:DUF3794 domain-containing protein [Clostridia bacterium]
MEFNSNKDCFSVCTTVFQSSAEHSIDCDVTLPEYMPDIVRILRCNAVSGVQSHQINGDRIVAECECLVKVLYICEEGKIHCFDQILHFSKQIELKSADTITNVCVGAKTDYVNYRVSGQRKFEVHGAVTVFAKADDKKKCEFISDVTGGAVTARCENDEICDLVSITEKTFAVSETVEAGTLTEPIGAIISQGAVAVIDELKIISNKIFLKGVMTIRLTFISQESCTVQTLENTINISQIIESPDIHENCKVDSLLSVANLDIRPRFDSATNKNLLDISANLDFSALCYCTRQITCIKDAYSTKYESDLKKTIVYAPTLCETIDDTFLCRGNADFSSGISKILSFNCGNTTSGFSIVEDGVVIRGEVTVDIIYEDTNGDISFTQRQIPFEYKRPLQLNDTVLTCKPHCVATASSYVLVEGNKIDIRIEIQIHGFVFSESEKNIVTEINIDKSKIKTVKTASLTVYFAECDESLWNIAEKYNTTVEAIMRENHLTGNFTEKKCKLLIPKV